jgi:hypothetical protein
MQLEYVFQNPLVIIVVIFGLSCTMGLSAILPVVANVILAVFSGWVADASEAKLKGRTAGGVFPDERDDFPKQVIGWGPEGKPTAPPPPSKVEVEPDLVPTGMLTKLTVALTVVAAAMVIFGMFLFDRVVADELAAKGYAPADEVVPHASAE